MNFKISYYLFFTINSFLGLITAVFTDFKREGSFSFVKYISSFTNYCYSFTKEENPFTKYYYSFTKEENSFTKYCYSFIKEESSFTKYCHSFTKKESSFTIETHSFIKFNFIMACNFRDRLAVPIFQSMKYKK